MTAPLTIYAGPHVVTYGAIDDAGPEALWAMSPESRPVDVLGAIESTAGGEAAILGVAKGGRTSFATRAVDDRATIRGAVAALYVTGQSKINPEALRSKVAQGKKEDATLATAIGAKGKSLKAAADVARRKITKAGLARAAWGYRGLYLLANLKGFAIARSAGAATASIFGPIGMAIGGLVAGHGALVQQRAQKLAGAFNAYVEEGTAGYVSPAAVAPMSSPVALSPSAATAAPSSSSWFPVLLGAGVLAVVLVVLARRRMAA